MEPCRRGYRAKQCRQQTTLTSSPSRSKQMARTNSARSLPVLAMLLSIGSMIAVAQQNYFDNWPPGTSPQEVGKRLAEHFVTSPHQGNHVFYGEVGTWYGALTFAHLTSDKELQEKLVRRFDPLLPGGSD